MENNSRMGGMDIYTAVRGLVTPGGWGTCRWLYIVAVTVLRFGIHVGKNDKNVPFFFFLEKKQKKFHFVAT